MKFTGKLRLVLLAVPLLLGLLLPACGSGSSSGSDQVTLNLLHSWAKSDPTGAAFQDLLTQFHTAHPNITIKQTINVEDLGNVYETSFVAGNEADVIMTNLIGQPLSWIKKKAVVPVQDYLQQWGLKDRILPTALQQWTTSDGQLQGFPYNGFKWPVWYNMGLLKQAGINEVPTTTDQLIADAQKLRAAGIGPMVIGGNDWSGNKLFSQVVESYLSDSEAKTLFTQGNYCGNPNGRKGVQLFTTLRDAGVFVDSAAGLNADNMDALFYTGKAAIMPAGSWAFKAAPTSLTANGNVYLGGLPVPGDGAVSKPSAYEGYTGTGVWISPNGQKKIDAVRTFVSFLYDPTSIAHLVEKGGMVPAVQNVQLDKDKVSPLLDQATNQLDGRVSYVLMPDTYVPAAVQDKFIRASSQAFIKGQTVDQICSAIQGAYS